MLNGFFSRSPPHNTLHMFPAYNPNQDYHGQQAAGRQQYQQLTGGAHTRLTMLMLSQQSIPQLKQEYRLEQNLIRDGGYSEHLSYRQAQINRVLEEKRKRQGYWSSNDH